VTKLYQAFVSGASDCHIITPERSGRHRHVASITASYSETVLKIRLFRSV